MRTRNESVRDCRSPASRRARSIRRPAAVSAPAARSRSRFAPRSFRRSPCSAAAIWQPAISPDNSDAAAGGGPGGSVLPRAGAPIAVTACLMLPDSAAPAAARSVSTAAASVSYAQVYAMSGPAAGMVDASNSRRRTGHRSFCGEGAMKRREFLKSTAAVAGAAALATPYIAQAQGLDVVNVGHLVGICMSPLFYAKSQDYFKAEGLDVQMKFMPNPGDALTALNSGAMDIIHNPFTNAFVAAGQGAPVRIIAGSGAGGLFLVAQKDSGIKSMADLAKAKGKGLKIG